jgi:hypothetical protein
MLRLAETQMTSSFRRPFIPIYQRSNNPHANSQRPSNIQRKTSQASSIRIPSVLSQRKRDSVNSQSSISVLTDIQNRVVIPPVYKQYRQSVVTTI